ncbi:Nn.00g096100.m01.CDS01 [Neocucurbitaria sp. VM-36]
MTQQLQSNSINGDWRSSKLPGVLAGDLAAAVISATTISPLITVIDSRKCCFKQPASLIHAEKSHPLILPSRLFSAAKPFFYVWTLYAATYTTANLVEGVVKVSTGNADQILVSSITFLSTGLVNVPLGVSKDIRFVQLYGRPTASNNALNTPSKTKSISGQAQAPPIRRPRFPRIVGATFLFRDAITIFGSINLPPILTSAIPDFIFSSPAIKMATMQTPVLSQVLATPVHLLGLDLYSSTQSTSAERTSRMRRSLGPTTAMRCSRIIPAFGVGLVLNTGLRDYFHENAGVTGSD